MTAHIMNFLAYFDAKIALDPKWVQRQIVIIRHGLTRQLSVPVSSTNKKRAGFMRSSHLLNVHKEIFFQNLNWSSCRRNKTRMNFLENFTCFGLETVSDFFFFLGLD